MKHFSLRKGMAWVALIGGLLWGVSYLTIGYESHPTWKGYGWTFGFDVRHVTWDGTVDWQFIDIHFDPGWWDGDKNVYIKKRTCRITLFNYRLVDTWHPEEV
jgi:hypothetical protein